MILQPGSAVPAGVSYLPATLDHVRWGRLPCELDAPVLSVDPGCEVVIDTISHEGILEDQGRDPRAFFEAYGIDEVLDDAVALAASDHPRTFGVDGPHVVTGPIEIRAAKAGDLLAIRVWRRCHASPTG